MVVWRAEGWRFICSARVLSVFLKLNVNINYLRPQANLFYSLFFVSVQLPMFLISRAQYLLLSLQIQS